MTDNKICINILFKKMPTEENVLSILHYLSSNLSTTQDATNLMKGSSISIESKIPYSGLIVGIAQEECGYFNLSLDFSWVEILKSSKELITIVDLIKKIHKSANPYLIYMDYEMVSFVNNKIDFANKKVLGFNQIGLFSKTMLNEFGKVEFPSDNYDVENFSDGAIFIIKKDLIEFVKKWEQIDKK